MLDSRIIKGFKNSNLTRRKIESYGCKENILYIVDEFREFVKNILKKNETLP